MLEGVPVNGIAGQIARIRLVGADAQVRFLAQAVQQGLGQALIIGKQQADVSGPWSAAVEARGEAVDRDDHGVVAPRGKARVGSVVGAIIGVEAAGEFDFVSVAIAGDDGAVVKTHQQGRVILAAVQINHQPGKPRQDGGGIEVLCQMPRYAGSADVMGDVTAHISRRQAKIAAVHVFRHMVGGVITGNQPSRGAVFADDFICWV